MLKRQKFNVTIKDVRIRKLMQERGVEVLVIFDRPDLINPEKPMHKRYKITNRQWFENLKSDYKKIGISLSVNNLVEEVRSAIGKSVLITYLNKGNGYSNIFFESLGVNNHYKEQSVNGVLEDILGDELPPPPPPDDSPFTDEDEEWLNDMF